MDNTNPVLAKAKAIVKQFYPEMPDSYEGRRVQIAITALRQPTQTDALREALENINRKASPRPDRALDECADDLYWCACEARKALEASNG